MTNFMRAGKWEGVMPLLMILILFLYQDLKSLSLKFGCDAFITFEMPR
jgi:hypothetical protein